MNIGFFALDMSGGRDAVHIRHIHIHHHHIWLKFLDHLDGLDAVGGFADHFKIFLELQGAHYIFTRLQNIIHHQDAGFAARFRHTPGR